MTGMMARRLAPIETAEMTAEIALSGVAAVCDLTGALFLPDHRALVVSDLHLEKGAAFARRGQLLPPYDTLATLRLLEKVVTRYQPMTIISLGDNFHDRVGSALMPLPFREMIVSIAHGRDLVWINGNHDPDGTTGLPGISADEIALAGLTFRHEPSLAHGKGEVAGHLHPSATVRRREKSVRRPCFATDGNRLVMPSFGVTTGGLDLRHKAFTGLFARADLIAHLLGRDRIYSVRYGNLLG
jgi:uncharacterized protein